MKNACGALRGRACRLGRAPGQKLSQSSGGYGVKRRFDSGGLEATVRSADGPVLTHTLCSCGRPGRRRQPVRAQDGFLQVQVGGLAEARLAHLQQLHCGGIAPRAARSPTCLAFMCRCRAAVPALHTALRLLPITPTSSCWPCRVPVRGSRRAPVGTTTGCERGVGFST
jgi:hypothetical protein